MQLLIPYAFVDTPGCADAVAPLQLPHLERLLQRLTLVHTDTGASNDLSPPHERVLAQALGMAAEDGLIPWAALELAQTGRNPGPGSGHWAWVTPAHWQIGTGGILMMNPATLQLEEAESRALVQAMAPYFAQDGIELLFDTPQRWLASGEALANLACASLDRVLGTDVAPWMPATAAVRRLQNEMQMLLYTHPVNDARAQRGLQAVNSFWVSGNGALGGTVPSVRPPRVADGLRLSALLGDWQSWADAWRQIDRGACQELLTALDRGGSVELVLCSDKNALHFASGATRWRDRLQRRFSRPTLQQLGRQL